MVIKLDKPDPDKKKISLKKRFRESVKPSKDHN